MNKSLKRILYTGASILVVWTALTVWVQYVGGEEVLFIGEKSALKNALVVYNPDPIYNLDEQVCRSFAQGLSEQGFLVKIATIRSAKKDFSDYDCYAFCANTYNWAPDWLTIRYIKKHPSLQNKNIVAITLGSGSTARAKKILDKAITSKGANLLRSESYWLLKPNDEGRLEEKNVFVALELAKILGVETGKYISNIKEYSEITE